LSFAKGNFTFNKTQRPLSKVSFDESHEQNNACVKDDGGAVGLTECPTALLRWMVSGPEMARVVGEFQDGLNRTDVSSHVRHGHHEDNPGTQMTFLKHVRALVTAITEIGNPFCDTGKDLLVRDTRVIADKTVVTSITKMEKLGCEQSKEFFKERLLDRTKGISETLSKNKLCLFRQQPKKDKSRSQKEISSIRQDRSLLSKLYITCQVCDTDLV